MELTYLGQAGFRVTASGHTILIDPYLSNYVVTGGFGDPQYFTRNFPSPLSINQLSGIDAVFITHAHADHCDIPTLKEILLRNPACRFIGPPPVERLLLENDFPAGSIVRVRVGKVYSLGSVEFQCVPAAHYELETDKTTGDHSYVGYLVRMLEVVVYHSGDTVMYPGMIPAILNSQWQVKVVCLPVNGRDESRDKMGIVGNLSVDEAVTLAKAIHASFLIPMHNDLFTINQTNPQWVARRLNEAKELSVLQLKPGESVNIK